ncbi:T9SS type B sorting domain-containing protein [Flavobacterium sp.]|uniref:T9SS type B sorting domain-containing protein n=1 Tax=Flavobacterium sp. TaxID=239 RepID=UPI0037B83103
MKKTTLLFFIFITINCFSQFSKTHFIPPLTSQTNLAEDQFLYISTPSTANVNFTITEIGGKTITGIVSNTAPYIYSIGNGDNTQLFTPKTSIGIVKNKGYLIEADDLIYASIRVTAQKNIVNKITTYAHAGGLVSKGNSALGTIFRLGAMFNPIYDSSVLNFASILSTENGTKVTISNIPIGTKFSDGSVFTSPITITLNKNESYVLALENYNDNNAITNSSKIIGALVETDKPVVVNSGSFGGSNSSATVKQNNVFVPIGRDVGFDQIVSYEKTGKEYIFVKGIGTDDLERVLLIANVDNTQVFINGTTLFKTLNKGEYADINGSYFTNGNLYVSTSEKVFAYQSIGGSPSPANQNLSFVPPLNCATPNVVDNIPYIDSIGNINYGDGSLNIVTETGATVTINGNPVPVPATPILGNLNFVCYSVPYLTGNIAVKSSKQVYVSFYSSNGNATYGGYYSGFDTKPEITSKVSIGATSSCIPNVVLKVSSISAYDTFEWSFNGLPIPNSNFNSYIPTQPGYYQVKGSITGCSSILSDKIPVSNCPTDVDNDTVIDNIDIDNDNDGITNCTESYGDQKIDISNSALKNVTVGGYSNSFSGTITTSRTTSATPFIGSADGSFITEVPAGIGNSATYTMTFAKPISLGMEYVTIANTTDLLNADAEYIVNSDINKTITVLNPDNQLLIDTNYDGIYESGVTQFSSFEIRFKLNNAIPLAAGTGTFKFLSYLTNSIRFTHINSSDANANKSTLRFFAVCVPKDSDGDGIPDQLDLDSDNDGIPDNIEAQGKNFLPYSNIDTNNDGLSDAYGPGINPVDSDADGVPDYLDLDSDNDGIYDVIESGSNATDANLDGIIDGNSASFGTNGLSDSVETSADSGVLKIPILDTDGDGYKNYIDLDSDNDGCTDVIEAGFLDPNGDGLLGNSPLTINANGIITSGIGYTIPKPNYLIAAPIVITTQPIVSPTCELQTATITLADNGGSTYQWQVSINGSTWNDIPNNAPYSGATTNTLLIKSVSSTINGYKYRVQLNKLGNSCGLLSSETTLTINPLPILNKVLIVQCDDNADGFSTFNLTVRNDAISSNFATDTFSYYNTLAGANSADSKELIATPLAFANKTPFAMSVWARVVNINGCASVVQLDLKVSVTQINSATFHRNFGTCDDTNPSDIDGFSEFDFHTVTTDIQAILPSPSSDYSIKYYTSEADALSEINEIANPSNFRNTVINKQDIWVRVDSNLDNACFGLGAFITLTVNPLPNINLNTNGTDDKYVCSDDPTLFVTLDSGILDGSSTNNYTYIWTKDGTILSGKTAATLAVNTAGIYTVEAISLKGCSRIRTLKVTASDKAIIQSIVVVDLTEVNSVTINVTGNGNYVYSLDDRNGFYQESNYFENVAYGIHEVFVSDKNGCGNASKTFAVIGVPKFFTPNNDGFNDYWNIKGVNANFNANAVIYIFDRYGKFLKQILPSSQGWDGALNGNPLPADDYWYTLKLEDGREAKGHFSLKR